jgi:hypothetical protein
LPNWIKVLYLRRVGVLPRELKRIIVGSTIWRYRWGANYSKPDIHQLRYPSVHSTKLLPTWENLIMHQIYICTYLHTHSSSKANSSRQHYQDFLKFEMIHDASLTPAICTLSICTYVHLLKTNTQSPGHFMYQDNPLLGIANDVCATCKHVAQLQLYMYSQ